MLLGTIAKRELKIHDLAMTVIEKKDLLRMDRAMRVGVCSWLQCTFDNIKFKFKADQEKERLKIEHHKRLRKACAERRLKGIERERSRRIMQQCFLAIQEETVEMRALRHLEELRRRYEDHVLILEAQLAQALGDEEAAKELVAEQVRRLEAEKKKAKEAEKAMKEAQKDARAARVERDKALKQRDEALDAKAEADRLREIAERERDEARA